MPHLTFSSSFVPYLSIMDNAEGQELKGGHPPAQKVGGMRVVQHKSHSDKSEAAKEPKMTPEEVNYSSPDLFKTNHVLRCLIRRPSLARTSQKRRAPALW